MIENSGHRAEWGSFGWDCACGAGREWALAPVDRARRAAQAHQRAELRKKIRESLAQQNVPY